ncbi:antibiotic biosynthesis monooxygenase family protein [Alloalcanivorax marinus]|uniref:antibiotic biosynthesis monooxygenase family protein n=1 Tax=Alloalcanivorax marinus TaxID=1177169 RepID=UPI0019313F82|nr:antibiotic biosynthesis monooxygenase [Alloalcanivorax marinus]MBL7248983.1 antibiotic biosynthesis monooxygenase [Alloalcanivorax marinus]
MKYIFEVRMKDGYTVEEYAEAWREASRVIQRAPGARGTYLHRKIGEPETLLAIAHWDSKAHRDAKDDSRSALVKAILEKHARTCDITPLGEFEEPEWWVPPQPGSGNDEPDNDGPNNDEPGHE